MTSSRSVIHRPSLILVITFVSVSICYYLFSSFPRPPTFQRPLNPRPRPPIYAQNGTKLEERPPKFDWHARQQHNPIPANLLIPLPHHRGTPSIPKIQYKFPVANVHHKPTAYELGKKQQVEERQDAARRAFARMWNGYRNTAWGRDVLYPISGRGTQILNNQTSWAVTLVESLDTLWIMGFKDEFAEAVTEVVANLDFSQSSEGQEFIEVWDVSVRVLGGLLAAYDVAGGKNGQFADVLLEKAVEMGDLLMGAFDTSNRMVIGRWDWRKAMAGEKQEPYENMILSELSAMTLEFTHLTQVTGDPKFYDAVQRIENMLAKHQEKSKLPGMWPIVADAVGEGRFDYEKGFGLGGMAHPTYDVLPKVSPDAIILLTLYDSKFRRLSRFIVLINTNIAIHPTSRPLHPTPKNVRTSHRRSKKTHHVQAHDPSQPRYPLHRTHPGALPRTINPRSTSATTLLLRRGHDGRGIQNLQPPRRLGRS